MLGSSYSIGIRPEQVVADWTTPTTPSTNIASSTAIRILTLPRQASTSELHLFIYMLTRNYELLRELAIKAIRARHIHRIAFRMIVVNDRLANDSLVIIVHLHDTPEVVSIVGVAVFRFGQMERPCACSICRWWRGC